MAGNASMTIFIGGDNSDFLKKWESTKRALRKGFGSDALAASESIATGLAGAVAALGAFGAASVKLAGDMEASRKALTTLLGDAQKAEEMLADLSSFAADTPFELPGLLTATKKLLAFGFASQDIIPMLASIGDAAAMLGIGEEGISRLTNAIGQMQAKGKVSAEEMMQLAEAGVPAWKFLAEAIGTDIPTAMKMAEKGAIDSTTGINALLMGMQSKFQGGMEAISKTIPGLLSTIKDNVRMVMVEIGDSIAKNLNLNEKLQEIADWLTQFALAVKTLGVKEALQGMVPPELIASVFVLSGALLGAAIPAMIAFGIAVWTAMAPLLSFIAIGAAVGLLAYEIWVNWEPLAELFRDLWTSISTAVSEAWTIISTTVQEGVSQVVTSVTDAWNAACQLTVDTWNALAGKIDLIVTKSVSRFARNTVDNLTTVRKLKEKGIEVYFEKENIWTLDSKGELLITIMSSLAQEESRSISENTTWGQRKRFADGKVSVAYSHFLGYDKGPDGCMVINKEQAETVKLLYRLYLSGLSMNAVARELTKRGLKTPFGRDIWRVSVVQSILTNEKYKGDALLQKQYTVDFLTKQIKRNEGEVPQYYVENNHEAIISPAVFDMVQNEIAKRKNEKTRYSGISIFSNKIKCGECGGWYGAKVWHSTDKYRKIVYQCNHKFSGDEKCHTPHVTEEEVKDWFVIAVNKLLIEKDEIIQNVEQVKAVLCDTIKMKEDQEHLLERLTSVSKVMHEYISENARVALNQEQYEKKYNRLAEEYESLKAQCDSLADTISNKEEKAALLDHFIKDLKEADSLLVEFDDRLWSGLVDYLTVHGKGDVRVMFKDGTEISI